MKEALRKKYFKKKNRYFSCDKYLVTGCSHQGAHVCDVKVYINSLQIYKDIVN